MQQRGTCLSLEDALVPESQCPIWTRDAFEFLAAVVFFGVLTFGTFAFGVSWRY